MKLRLALLVFFLSLALGAQAQRNLSVSPADALMMSDANIVLSGDISGPPVHMKWVEPVVVDLRQAVEGEVLRIARAKFTRVNLTKEAGDPADVLTVQVDVSGTKFNVKGFTNWIKYSVSFSLHSTSGERLVKTDKFEVEGTHDFCWFAKDCSVALGTSLTKTFKRTLLEAFSQFLNEPDATSFIRKESQLAQAETELLASLQPHRAAYRVTESTGNVRSKPNSKSRVVATLTMDGIVQTLARLPTGWLQIAKEGDAIGWIHESSVHAETADTSTISAQIQTALANSNTNALDSQVMSGGIAPITLAAMSAESRIALIIGNSSYPGLAALKNPVNDAGDMAAKLKGLGFDVTLKTNVNLKQMLRAMTEFGDKLSVGSVALFFYAGHGMQVRGKNYLIPIDAEIGNEAAVSSEAVDADQLLDKLAPARVSMVILDACRNNPFERRFRSGSGGGLAQMNAPAGTLVAYATAPGKVASDGTGRNGLYTQELLRAMGAPNQKVEDVFKRVRANVLRKSGETQIPWESSSLTGDFYFVPGTAQ